MHYTITGIHCDACVTSIKEALLSSNQINDVVLDKTGKLELQTTEELELTQLQNRIPSGYIIHEGKPNLTQQHDHHHHQEPDFHWKDTTVWKRSAFNTLNCLIGCSIGDFGMIIFLQAYYPETALYTQMILAVIAGLCTSIILETIIIRVRENMLWMKALKVAFGMSFISMVAMEITMNLTDFMITGGRAAFSDPMYWFAFIPAAVAGFLVPWPYNYYKLKKYRMACH